MHDLARCFQASRGYSRVSKEKTMQRHSKQESAAVKLFGVALLVSLQGCANYSELISAESDKSNSEAVQLAQQQATMAEARGCKAVAISGGPSLALGIVVGDSCADCKPVQQSQRRQLYVVNVLMQCRGDRNDPRK